MMISEKDDHVICPKCHLNMSRVPRKKFDKLIHFLSFGKLRNARYKCIHCGTDLLK